MTMNNGRKTAILEAWYAIDYALLNGRVGSRLDEEMEKNYVTAKGAFLSNLYEIYAKIDYDPILEFSSVEGMVNHARGVATISKERAKAIMESSSASSIIREEMAEFQEQEGMDNEYVANFVIQKRYNAVVLDSLMLESVIASSGGKSALNDWTGKVLVDANKTLIDMLIDDIF